MRKYKIWLTYEDFVIVEADDFRIDNNYNSVTFSQGSKNVGVFMLNAIEGFCDVLVEVTDET